MKFTITVETTDHPNDVMQFLKMLDWRAAQTIVLKMPNNDTVTLRARHMRFDMAYESVNMFLRDMYTDRGFVTTSNRATPGRIRAPRLEALSIADSPEPARP